MQALRLVFFPLLAWAVFAAPDPKQPEKQIGKCIDFPTGNEEYLILDSEIPKPQGAPADTFIKGQYKIDVYKQNDDKGECMYKVVEGTLQEINIFTAKMGCLVDEPIGKVFTFFDKDAIILKLTGSTCLKVEVAGNKLAKTCVKNPCNDLEDFDCPAPEPNKGDGIFTELDKDHWSKPYLQSLMKLRLIPKTMDDDLTPEGDAIGKDKPLDVYAGTPEEAEAFLKKENRYTFYDMSWGRGAGHLEQLFDNPKYKDAQGKFLVAKNTPTIMIVHPLSADGDSKFVTVTVRALRLRKLHRHNNIIVVDMPDLSENMFMSVMNMATKGNPMIEPIAAALGDFFVESIKKNLLRPEDVHLIGWSYSGTLVGYIGRYVEQQTSKRIGSIVALDPFGSTQTSPYLVPVNAQDATTVHVHHSNAFPFGTIDRVGTADFTYNNGFIQPECQKNPSPIMCSHQRVVQRFWYVILYGNSGRFEARQCDNLVNFNAGQCDNNPTARLTYPIDTNPAKGTYFLRTLPTKPYGDGIEYSKSDPKLREAARKALEDNPHLTKRLTLAMFMGMSLNMDY